MALRAITFDFWRTLFRDANVRERQRARVDALVAATGAPEEAAKTALNEAHMEFLRVHIMEQRTLQPHDAIPMVEKSLGLTCTPEVAEALAETFATAILKFSPEPIEGALEAVQTAAGKVRVGLISDTGISPGSSLEKILERHGFLEHLAVLTFSDVVGAAKPQAIAFADAAGRLGVRPDEVLHIGDLEPTDIAGALAFGAQAGLFAGDNDKYLGQTQARYTFTSWPDFVACLPQIL